MNIFDIDFVETSINGVKKVSRGPNYIKGIFQDSRLAMEDCLFVAIKGEAFDGHNYLKMAYENGARHFIVEREEVIDDFISRLDVNVYLVNNTVKALQQIAQNYLKEVGCRVVGVTGSNGKTTTRDIIAHILGKRFRVHRNKSNYNTVVGVPITILEMPKDTEIAVLEMGMEVFGEIREIVSFTHPEIAVITNIGTAHLNTIGTRENIFKAKMEITSEFDEDNLLIVNYSDEFLNKNTIDNVRYKRKIVAFEGDDAKDYDVRLEDIKLAPRGSGFTYRSFLKEKELIFEKLIIDIPGSHNIKNVGVAITVALELGMNEEEIRERLKTFEGTEQRLTFKEAHGYTIIDDCYNASPASTKAGLEVLNMQEGRKIGVFGGVIGLADGEIEYHNEMGREARFVCDKIYTVGRLGRLIDRSNYFETKNELIKALKAELKEGDMVYIKASHGIALEEVVEELLK